MGTTHGRPTPAAAQPQTPAPRVTTRLEYSVYQALEKQVGLPTMGPACTELMAGYAMGAEKVLRLLREGFTIDPR